MKQKDGDRIRPGGSSVQQKDETASFRRLVKGVTPLRPASRRVSPRAVPAELSPRSADTPPIEIAFEIDDDGIRIDGWRKSLRLNTLRKLRDGGFPINSRLDLHGLRTGEARSALDAFLLGARQRGDRCALVIHGKGIHSLGGVGVLRAEIGEWLTSAPSKLVVTAFATALPSDGGAGAVYVLLVR